MPARPADSLFRQHAAQQRALAVKRAETERREMAALPFAPRIHHHRQHSTNGGDGGSYGAPSAMHDIDAYLREVRERDRLRDELRRATMAARAAEELKACTFKPRIIEKLPALYQRILK
jgi:hypothetical protein